jgi:hypothetical protein
VSGYYIANEVRTTAPGMAIAIDDAAWETFRTIEPSKLARQLLRWAKLVQLPKFKRHPRGRKTPVPKRTRFADKTPRTAGELSKRVAGGRKGGLNRLRAE